VVGTPGNYLLKLRIVGFGNLKKKKKKLNIKIKYIYIYII